MPTQKWRGRLVIEYSPRELEELTLEARASGKNPRQFVEADARDIAQTACPGIHHRTSVFTGNIARFTFATDPTERKTENARVHARDPRR